MPLIRDVPVLEWAAGQDMVLRLDPLTLPAGREVADFSTFTLTIREDPLWPRVGIHRPPVVDPDPIADGWPVVVTSTGALDDDEVPEFTFTMPDGAGVNRYAFDSWASLTAGGEVQLLRATYLTCGARVTA